MATHLTNLRFHLRENVGIAAIAITSGFPTYLKIEHHNAEIQTVYWSCPATGNVLKIVNKCYRKVLCRGPTKKRIDEEPLSRVDYSYTKSAEISESKVLLDFVIAHAKKGTVFECGNIMVKY